MHILSKVFLASSVLSMAIAPAAMADNETKTTENKKVLTAEQRTCMVTALTKRDNAVLSALDTYQGAWKTALTARRDALSKAWALENRDERMKASREAWSLFKNSHKTAQRSFHDGRETAWETFKTDRKACGSHVMREDRTSIGQEAQ
jgi:predicted lipoprotein with Yx(FWY)xxD motif